MSVHRTGWLLCVVWALVGCVFDGFTLPADVEASPSATAEPVEDRATFRLTEGTGKSVYSRFVRVAPNRYAWEIFALDGDKPLYQALEASFSPLESGWHMLHWRSVTGYLQGIHVVRFSNDQMHVAEVSKLEAEIARRIGAPMHIKVSKQFGGRGLELEGITAAQLQFFLKGVSGLAGLPAQRHTQVQAVPPALRQAAIAEADFHFASFDLREAHDPARAARMLAYFRVLHEEGVGLGSYAYSRFALNGWGMTRDPALARRLAATALERGVLRTHALLGYLAYYGDGEPVDHVKAVRHFRQAAAVGDGRACHGLGMAHLHGHGVPKNAALAAEWFDKGVEQVVPLSNVAMAELLIQGKDITQDDKRAVVHLDRAVAAMNPAGYQWRAWMHASGRGGPKNEAEATRLYLLAAQSGLPISQWQAGERLLAGVGIKQDQAAGIRWLKGAADGGVEQAKAALARVAAGPSASSGTPSIAGSTQASAPFDCKTFTRIIAASENDFSKVRGAEVEAIFPKEKRYATSADFAPFAECTVSVGQLTPTLQCDAPSMTPSPKAKFLMDAPTHRQLTETAESVANQITACLAAQPERESKERGKEQATNWHWRARVQAGERTWPVHAYLGVSVHRAGQTVETHERPLFASFSLNRDHDRERNDKIKQDDSAGPRKNAAWRGTGWYQVGDTIGGMILWNGPFPSKAQCIKTLRPNDMFEENSCRHYAETATRY